MDKHLRDIAKLKDNLERSLDVIVNDGDLEQVVKDVDKAYKVFHTSAEQFRKENQMGDDSPIYAVQILAYFTPFRNALLKWFPLFMIYWFVLLGALAFGIAAIIMWIFG